MSTTKTLYFNSDQHTINGLTAYKLTDTQYTGTALELNVSANAGDSSRDCNIKYSLYVRHSDTTETTIATDVGSVTFSDGLYSYRTSSYDISELDLALDDALKVIVTITHVNSGNNTTATLVSEQLSSIQIIGSTIGFSILSRSYLDAGAPPTHCDTWFNGSIAEIGESRLENKMTNVELQIVQDIGMRYLNGGTTYKVLVKDLESTDKVRIRKASTTYGIPLVDTSNSVASPIRIYDGSSILSLVEGI